MLYLVEGVTWLHVLNTIIAFPLSVAIEARVQISKQRGIEL